MKPVLLLGVLLSVMVMAPAASAEEKNVITLPVVEVQGTARRPAVVVEVTKVRMQLPTSTPTLAGAAKIHAASKKDPF